MRYIYTILIILLASAGLQAQTFYSGREYGVLLGGSQYFGDLNENYGFKFIRPAIGAYIRYHLNPYISVKGEVNYTLVGYSDSYNTNDPYSLARNLSFQSNIIEVAAMSEFNFFRFSTGEDGSRFTPYLTGGLGVFYYNPITYLNGKRYALRQYGTEGQNAGLKHDYSNFAVCFPIGAGVKYWAKPGFNIGFEIADRLTTTDYLDDVSTTYAGFSAFPSDPRYPNIAAQLQNRSTGSNTLGEAGKQRGNSTSFDQYLMFQVSISIQFKTYRCPGYITHDIPRLQ